VASHKGDQTGEARFEILMPQPVVPAGPFVALPDDARLAQHPEMTALGRPADRQLEGNAGKLGPRSQLSQAGRDGQSERADRQDIIYIQITLVRGRSDVLKQAFYRAAAKLLSAIDGVRDDDVAIVLTENDRADYSWGRGEAQLLAMGAVPGAT
jgi:hypothetical protein